MQQFPGIAKPAELFKGMAERQDPELLLQEREHFKERRYTIGFTSSI